MSSTLHRIILCLTIFPVLTAMRKILSESAIERTHVISVSNGFNSKRMTKLNFHYRNITLPCLSEKNPVSLFLFRDQVTFFYDINKSL